jgi:large subunit ribosomal protein L13
VDTLSYKTISANAQTVEKAWHIVDGTNLPLGRLCTKVASVLRGKTKPSFTPHADCGDYVIVINADKVSLSGDKWNQKEYLSYSGYTGGQKKILAKDLMDKKPTAMVEKAVRGMLPKTKLGRAIWKNLFVYAGTDHPHTAQKPQTLNI